MAWDKDIAKAVQTAMDGAAADKINLVKPSGTYLSKCSQNIYTETNPSKVNALAISDAATKAWYAGKSSYDFKLNAPKKSTIPPKPLDPKVTSSIAAENKKFKEAADKFSLIVWKATTKVGFGIKGKYVIAWYCETMGNVAGKYKENVVQDCVKDGVDTCYALRALNAHNVKRSRHKFSKPMTHWKFAS